MQDPETDAEWQGAVDAARAALELESARQYGLVVGGPDVDMERCYAVLARGEARGIVPSPDSGERFIREWNERATLKRTTVGN
jgi:hypothetical protein